jgi:hypothetical protein
MYSWRPLGVVHTTPDAEPLLDARDLVCGRLDGLRAGEGDYDEQGTRGEHIIDVLREVTARTDVCRPSW